jgi:hypothetical protein
MRFVGNDHMGKQHDDHCIDFLFTFQVMYGRVNCCYTEAECNV